VLEATYRIQVAPWWSVQPDLQYVFNPSGERGSHDALVLGLRTTVSF
jgi:porin